MGTMNEEMTRGKSPAKKSGGDLKVLIEQAQSKFAEVAPKWLSIERLVRLALAARSRNPKLAECTAESFLLFCMRCAETGLEPIGAGGAWPVPYFNGKTKQMEVQFIPDWRGLIQLAKKTEQIKHAYAEVVKEGDEISIQKGDAPSCHHVIATKGRGKTIGAYCIVTLPDDSKHIEWMDMEDLNSIQERSKAKDTGPWKTNPDEMRKKTVVRRALKPFASSPEMQTAIEYDNQAIGFSVPDRTPIAEPQEIPEAEVVPVDDWPELAANKMNTIAKLTTNSDAIDFLGNLGFEKLDQVPKNDRHRVMVAIDAHLKALETKK
jgi:recombination protein RecT